MSDSHSEEPVTGNDPTNGLAGDLEGDDGGVAERNGNTSLAEQLLAGIDPDRPVDDEDDGVTSYSEEGKP